MNELADLQTRWNSLTKEEEIKYGIEIEEDRKTIVWPWEASHWPQCEEALKRKIQTPAELEEILISISHTNHAIKFFSEYFEDEGKSQKDEFFNETLPFIQQLALKMPTLFPQTVHIPILVPQIEQTAVFSKEQVASILACAFFGTFDRYAPAAFTKFKFSDFTFSELLIDSSCKSSVLCLFNYFKRISKGIPKGNLTVRRVVLKDDKKPNWESSTNKLKNVSFVASSILQSKTEVHVDFSNELIGGGVLSGSSLEEESLFLMKPECLITMVFCAKLEPNEAILIYGAEQFSKCEGFNFNFKFIGDFQDDSPRDETGTIKRTILAIDPLPGSVGEEQFQEKQYYRDLHKLYLGFSSVSGLIATGLWGCGPMRGDKKLKFFQQILAAAEAKVDLEFNLDNNKDQKQFSEFFDKVREANPTVGELHKHYFHFVNNKLETHDVFKSILESLGK